MENLLETYNHNHECHYKNEHYSVRDNGAVFRHYRKNKPTRILDNQWTFGKPNNYGYMLIASEVVHRIVAYAFLGEPPTNQHVVDHIDTNRQNNRPENLRWVTKLENILNNPITLKRIIFRCGSIEDFLKDPSILKNYEKDDPNFTWMRTVSSQEAKVSWERLVNWANKANKSTLTQRGVLGEWLYQNNQNNFSNHNVSEFKASKTPNAVQKNWSAQSEFISCPKLGNTDGIIEYSRLLKVNTIFFQNVYYTTTVVKFEVIDSGESLLVLYKINKNEGLESRWGIMKIEFNNEKFIHEIILNYNDTLEHYNSIDVENHFKAIVDGGEWSPIYNSQGGKFEGDYMPL